MNRFILEQVKNDDQRQLSHRSVFPIYNPKTHYLEITKNQYFHDLVILRHYIKVVSDDFFGRKLKFKNIDLFMLTPSVSSPMGPGSDSKPIPIKFGKYKSNLVDSSQFGFEPILINNFDKVYCYLPSMRGEDPDKRHLNQFYHCEAEIVGKLETLYPIIENYIKYLSELLISMPNILKRMSADYDKSVEYLNNLLEVVAFPEITFDEAVDALVKAGYKKLINFTDKGRDISNIGEKKIVELFNFKTPFWIKKYDRDRVPFYQKPDPSNLDKVLNADLILPPILRGSFGGEVAGCGQRQDNVEEMFESLQRQNISSEVYEWYINLRKLSNYKVTSGFGLGIERFIVWVLCRDDIKNTILYPRLKNVKTYP